MAEYSRDQALTDLIAISKLQSRDVESNHTMADEVLLRLINDSEISEAYGRIEKWYA